MNPFGWIDRWLRNRRATRPQAAPEFRLRVVNLTRKTVLATSMAVADSAPKRSRGLLGRDRLAPGAGLWIVPCEAVHTFAMKFPIDLVYLDRNFRIKKLRSAVPPWRLSGCLTAHSILELPAGAIRSTLSQTGDLLEFSAASAPGSPADTPDQTGAETSQ
jgi:uncharacterized membrane protein (UPF0127 family)